MLFSLTMLLNSTRHVYIDADEMFGTADITAYMFRTIHSWNAQAWPYLYNTKLISSFSWLLQITYISSSAYMQVLSTNVKFIYATHLNQLTINVNSYYLSIDLLKLENYSYSFIYRFGHDGHYANLILSYHTLTQYMITITHYHWSLSITNSLTKQQNSPTHLHIRPNQENNKFDFLNTNTITRL